MPIDTGFVRLFSEHEQRTVRESVALPVKIRPFDVTLSTTDVAEDLINITSHLPPAQNLITNPSMEAGDPSTGWTAVSSVLDTVQTGTVVPRTGTDSLESANSNLVANEGAYFEVTGMVPGNYALSAYVRRVGGGTVIIRGSSDSGVTFTDSAAITMDDTWQRINVIHKLSDATETTLRLYLVTNTQQNITWWMEDAQIEPAWSIVDGFKSPRDNPLPGASVTDFIDPSSDRFAQWLGTANASISVREPGLSEIHSVHYVVVGTGDVYVDFDRDASTTLSPFSGEGEAVNGPKVVKTRVSFINAVSGETPRVRGWVTGV